MFTADTSSSTASPKNSSRSLHDPFPLMFIGIGAVTQCLFQKFRILKMISYPSSSFNSLFSHFIFPISPSVIVYCPVTVSCSVREQFTPQLSESDLSHPPPSRFFLLQFLWNLNIKSILYSQNNLYRSFLSNGIHVFPEFSRRWSPAFPVPKHAASSTSAIICCNFCSISNFPPVFSCFINSPESFH